MKRKGKGFPLRKNGMYFSVEFIFSFVKNDIGERDKRR
jgi:hypothetical protein